MTHISMRTRVRIIALFSLAFFCASAGAATFGTVVPIGGQAADIALDEPRRSLYIANFTGNRIDVLSLDTNAIVRSIQVAAQPGALAISRDGKYLVIAHYGNFAAATNSVTILNLTDSSRRVFGVGAAPLGVAFGANDQALLVTAKDFILLDPVTGQTRTIETVDGLAVRTLPVPVPALPSEIVRASLTASLDGLWIYGLTDKFLFRYNVGLPQLSITGYTSRPEMGPRTVSVSSNGSYYTAGWALFDRQGTMTAQFPNPSGKLDIGSHVVDSEAGVIYAQLIQADTAVTPGVARPTTTANTAPTLDILAADNLAVIERLRLRENLTGRSVLNSARDVVYAVSAGGVTVLPVGQRGKAPRVKADGQDIIFRGNSCVRRQETQEIAIVDTGGNSTAFSLVPSGSGITVSPSSGVTPTVVRITIDPGAFDDAKGTSVRYIDIRAPGAVNFPDRIRVLVNNRDPDQRGAVHNVPGKLVDVLADPSRDRFMIVRQDTNEVLVFDRNMRQTAALRTGNTPTQMAMSSDSKYLIVGNNNSQIASVFDLDTLQSSTPVRFPAGHYPRSIAVSGNAILASVRSTSGPHTIDRIDMFTRTAHTPARLGVYTNEVNINTSLAASPDGSSILIAQADGKVMLYNANFDTFVARRDFEALSGAVAASSFNVFAVDNYLLNSSLIPVGMLDKIAGSSSSGFVFSDLVGFRSLTSGVGQAGIIERVNLSQLASILPTRTTESPLIETTGFSRTLAVLGNREGLVSLSTSGFTVLPWNYDASFAPPRIDRVVNAADQSDNFAPGSLVTIFGAQLSPIPGSPGDLATGDALSQSCLTINGAVAPVVFSSPDRINAQLPFNVAGTVTLVLRTPGGPSDPFRLRTTPGAPGVFRSGPGATPTIVRSLNNELVTLSNPIHGGDGLVIYATGLGRTDPEVPLGATSPFEPLARVLNPPKVTLGNVELPIYFAGLTPGLIGVYQINVIVPRAVPFGFDIPLRIEQGESATTVPVRVVP